MSVIGATLEGAVDEPWYVKTAASGSGLGGWLVPPSVLLHSLCVEQISLPCTTPEFSLELVGIVATSVEGAVDEPWYVKPAGVAIGLRGWLVVPLSDLSPFFCVELISLKCSTLVHSVELLAIIPFAVGSDIF